MIFLVLVSYCLPILALVSCRMPMLTPAFAFVLFFNMHYGPHSLNPEWLRMSGAFDEHIHLRYAYAILTSNVMIAVGMFFSRSFFRRALAGKHFAANAPGNPEIIDRFFHKPVFMLLCALYVSAFLLLDGPGLPRTAEVVRYFFDVSSLSYDDIRRSAFSNSLIELVSRYARQNSSAIIIVICAIMATTSKRKYLFFLIIVLVFFTSTIQLNKFPVLYTIVTVFVSLYIYFNQKLSLTKNFLLKSLIVVSVMIAALRILYQIQYRDALSVGALSSSDLNFVVIYRAFLNQADGLRMWFAEFPESTPFVGLSTFTLGARLMGEAHLDVHAYLPARYIGNYNTTFVGGFIGAGYAGFGFLGIAFYAFFCGALVVALSVLSLSVRSRVLRATYLGVMFMNVYFLDSRELTTAMLSGGVLLTPILIFAADRMLTMRSQRFVAPVDNSIRRSGW